MTERERVPKSRRLTPRAIGNFQRTIYDFFREQGRSFPWRETSDPYCVLVSEIMLQQTQVKRVKEKYDRFLGMFPDFDTLAKASLREVLAAWQGLGYNRRAVALQGIARRVITEFAGKLPPCFETLLTFPGIGPATAGALVVFAYNKPAVFIETNIRRVFIHFFFTGEYEVSDKDILPLVQATVDSASPRSWYYALMDYGAMLKSSETNPNRRSAHYNRQSPFEGSDRQIRGLIIRLLIEQPVLRMAAIVEAARSDPKRVKLIMNRLIEEGLLSRSGDQVRIAATADVMALSRSSEQQTL